MPPIKKQIGWSQEANLLYEIYKALYNIKIVSGGSGGSQDLTSVTGFGNETPDAIYSRNDAGLGVGILPTGEVDISSTGNGSVYARILAELLTDIRTIQVPDASGTILLEETITLMQALTNNSQAYNKFIGLTGDTVNDAYFSIENLSNGNSSLLTSDNLLLGENGNAGIGVKPYREDNPISITNSSYKNYFTFNSQVLDLELELEPIVNWKGIEVSFTNMNAIANIIIKANGGINTDIYDNGSFVNQITISPTQTATLFNNDSVAIKQ